MGQYFALVNLDKKQWVHAHRIGNGLKLGEQTGWKYSTEVAAGLLQEGPWAGDTRIGFVGDNGGSFAVDGCSEAPDGVVADLYDQLDESSDWTEISAQVRELMSARFGIRYTGDGWLEIIEPDGEEAAANMTPDMVLSINRRPS